MVDAFSPSSTRRSANIGRKCTLKHVLDLCNIQTDVRNIGLTCVTYYSSMLPI